MGNRALKLDTGTPNLSELLKEAKRLGCTVAIKRRSGEIRIDHPKVEGRLNLNSRRKDGTRAAIIYLRRLQEHEASKQERK